MYNLNTRKDLNLGYFYGVDDVTTKWMRRGYIRDLMYGPE